MSTSSEAGSERRRLCIMAILIGPFFVAAFLAVKRISLRGTTEGDVRVVLLGTSSVASIVQCSCDRYLNLECDRPADHEHLTLQVEHVQQCITGEVVLAKKWSSSIFCEFYQHQLYGDNQEEVAVYVGSSAVGGKNLLGIRIPSGHNRESLCSTLDHATVVLLNDVDTALEEHLEELLDKAQDVMECAGAWCKCALCEAPQTVLQWPIVSSTLTLPLRVLGAAASGAALVRDTATGLVLFIPRACHLLPPTAEEHEDAANDLPHAQDCGSYVTSSPLAPTQAHAEPSNHGLADGAHPSSHEAQHECAAVLHYSSNCREQYSTALLQQL
ncbi:hypothetical protein JKP88DRAFT_308752 [Tribonema minus]|uniref:Uncharacterized protein n=1 Tax=Tribonema minus TaxID=303371 RepID=A0A835Z6G0_9STRA|nr:hypothetical protein JKP88DRAFT_308752 [Tribonema minus]